MFRELENLRTLKTLCIHFNDILGRWGDRDQEALDMPCYGVFILFQREYKSLKQEAYNQIYIIGRLLWRNIEIKAIVEREKPCRRMAQYSKEGGRVEGRKRKRERHGYNYISEGKYCTYIAECQIINAVSGTNCSIRVCWPYLVWGSNIILSDVSIIYPGTIYGIVRVICKVTSVIYYFPSYIDLLFTGLILFSMSLIFFFFFWRKRYSFHLCFSVSNSVLFKIYLLFFFKPVFISASSLGFWSPFSIFYQNSLLQIPNSFITHIQSTI